jgi:YHS domain-containing protein
MKKIFPILGMAILLSAAIITLAITGESVRDPVCGMNVDPATTTFKIDSPNGTVYFCSKECMEKFQADPAAYMQKPKTEAKKPAVSGADSCGTCPMKCSAAKAASAKEACGCKPALKSLSKTMKPVSAALERNDLPAVKMALLEMVAKKDALAKVDCSDKKCSKEFMDKRAELCLKVDELATAANADDSAAAKKAFKEVQTLYNALCKMEK